MEDEEKERKMSRKEEDGEKGRKEDMPELREDEIVIEENIGKTADPPDPE